MIHSYAPESQQSYRRTLRYAEAIAGGQDRLASRLHVSCAALSAWVAGTNNVPDAVFLSAVDLICEASDEDIRRAREYQPTLSETARRSFSRE